MSTQASSKPKLQTRNVFVDTCGFINENFAITSTAFRSLFSLCRMNKAFLKLTDITVRELDDHLASELTDALKARDGGMAKLKILRNLDWPSLSGIFMALEHDELYSDLHKRLHAELKNAKAEILPAMNISADVVFQKYFDRKPPFGPSKKKAEFPDAFVCECVEAWCAKKKRAWKLGAPRKSRRCTSLARTPICSPHAATEGRCFI